MIAACRQTTIEVVTTHPTPSLLRREGAIESFPLSLFAQREGAGVSFSNSLSSYYKSKINFVGLVAMPLARTS